MRKPGRWAWALWALLAWAGCGSGSTGGDLVELPLRVQGGSPETFQVGDWSVRLTRADVGFGPVYFCATENANQDLCATAVAEFRGTTTIDGLDPKARRVGDLQATTGALRSSMLDYGIAWLLPDQRPAPRPGAPGGHSAVLEGNAQKGAASLRFVLRVDVAPIAPGDAAVNALRTRYDIEDDGSRLTVRVQPHLWLSDIDFDAWAATHEGEGPLTAGPGDPPYENVVLGMIVNDPPDFEWQRQPVEAP